MIIKIEPHKLLENNPTLKIHKLIYSRLSFLKIYNPLQIRFFNNVTGKFLKEYHRSLPMLSFLFGVFLFLSGDVSAQLENHIFNSPITTAIEHSELKTDSQKIIRNSDIYSSWMFKSNKLKSTDSYPGFIVEPQPLAGKNILGLTSLNYFKNNEYSEYHNPGETFLGTQLILGLNNVTLKHKERYFRDPKKSNERKLLQSRMNLGLLLNYPYGSNQAQVFPLMNIQYFFKRAYFNFGSLNSNTNHRLIEALYNYEFTFTRPVEYGLEYRRFSKRLDFNSWLEFRQLAIRKTSQQEIISFGNRFNYQIIPAEQHTFGRLTVPIQTMVYHKGGEALAIGKPISTLLNFAAGIKYTSNRNFWNSEILYLGSQDISPESLKTLKNGHAFLSNTSIYFNNNLNVVLSYFNGYNFSSPLGAKLFSNEYVAINDIRTHRRQMIQSRFVYSKQIANSPSIIDFRVEPIYIIDRNQFAFSTGLYFKYIIGHYTY